MAALSLRNLQPLSDVVVFSFVAKLKSDIVGLSLLIKWPEPADNIFPCWVFSTTTEYVNLSLICYGDMPTQPQGTKVRNFNIAEKDDISYYASFVGTYFLKCKRSQGNVTLSVSCGMVEPEVDFLMSEEITQGVRSSTRVGRLAKERLHKVPAEPPDWNDEFKDPKLLLVVDIGSARELEK
ncbi:hypothetical protein Tco_1317889 [Tanacetum coccineum]